MWFDGQRQPNTIYVANTSRGKDSTAMLRAIQLMGWPLDMICSVDIWFDDDTPAELPPMVVFKDDYDRKVFERFGISVTRLCAMQRLNSNGQNIERERETYASMFYSVRESGYRTGTIAGWPMQKHPWCNKLKTEKVDLYRTVLQTYKKPFLQGADQRIPNPKRKLVHFRSEARRVRSPLEVPQNEGQRINIVHYIGIAADEPLRIAKHLPKKDKVLPLVQIGWDEDLCGLEAKYMDMLSPTYTDGQMRDGCWFCHNQGVNQLRRLRKMYPDLWAKLMKLDLDSPVTFHADGYSVHDFDRRFALEDDGLVDPAEPWKWSMLDEELNYRLF